MLISYWWILIATCICVIPLWKKISYKGVLWVLVIVNVLLAWLIPDVTIFEKTGKEYTHSTKFILGSYEQEGIAIGSSFLENRTDDDMIIYPTTYMTKQEAMEEPDPISLPAQSYLKKNISISYYFETPPDEISIKTEWYEEIFNKITNSNQTETKWTIDLVSNIMQAANIDESSLKPGEYTTGQIVFKAPKGFSCQKVEDNDGIAFQLEYPNTASMTVVSAYDNDMSKENFDAVCQNFKDSDADGYYSKVVKSEQKSINGHPYWYRVISYATPNNNTYWRCIMMFDEATGKACFASAYDGGYDRYVNQFISSVRFQ